MMRLLSFSLLLLSSACGAEDPGTLLLAEGPATASSLLGVVVELRDEASACERLWNDTPMGLAETRKVGTVESGVFLPVALHWYDALTLILYGLDAEQTPTSGGCQVRPLAAEEERVVVHIQLDPKPE